MVQGVVVCPRRSVTLACTYIVALASASLFIQSIIIITCAITNGSNTTTIRIGRTITFASCITVGPSPQRINRFRRFIQCTVRSLHLQLREPHQPPVGIAQNPEFSFAGFIRYTLYAQETVHDA
jgi:hypothetical protein